MKLGRWPCQELNQERIGAEFACAVAGQEQITTHTLMILVRTTVAIRENPRALMINFSWGEVNVIYTAWEGRHTKNTYCNSACVIHVPCRLVVVVLLCC